MSWRDAAAPWISGQPIINIVLNIGVIECVSELGESQKVHDKLNAMIEALISLLKV